MSHGIETTNIEILNDPATIQMIARTCANKLQGDNGRATSRELALAATKLQEAALWIDEHIRLNK